MNSYAYFDFVLRSEIDIPELPIVEEKTAPDLVIEPKTIDRSQYRNLYHDWEDFRCYGSDGNYLLEFPELALIEIMPQTSTVFFSSEPGVGDALVRHLLLDHALPRLISHRGELIVHASCIAKGQTSVMFVGETGAGKSTLAAAFAARGWRVVSDDAVLLRMNGESISAVGSYSSVRLEPEALARLVESQRGNEGHDCYSGKRRLILSDHSGGPVPLDALVLIKRAGKLSCRRLSGAGVVMRLIGESFALDPGDAASASGRMKRAGRIAGRLRIFDLGFPHRYDVLPALQDGLLHHLGQTA